MTHPNEITEALGELVFEDEGAAVIVMASINHEIATRGYITVGQLKTIIGDPSTYVDDQWGWRAKHLSDFSITKYDGEGAGENDHQLNYPESGQI